MKRFHFTTLTIGALAGAASVGAQTAKRPMSFNDIMELKNVGSVATVARRIGDRVHRERVGASERAPVDRPDEARYRQGRPPRGALARLARAGERRSTATAHVQRARRVGAGVVARRTSRSRSCRRGAPARM